MCWSGCRAGVDGCGRCIPHLLGRDATARATARGLQRPHAAPSVTFTTRHLRPPPHLVSQVEHGKADGVPQLVAPVAVGHHALDVQVDVAALQAAKQGKDCKSMYQSTHTNTELIVWPCGRVGGGQAVKLDELWRRVAAAAAAATPAAACAPPHPRHVPASAKRKHSDAGAWQPTNQPIPDNPEATAAAHQPCLRGVRHQRKAQRVGAALLDALGEVGALARRRLLNLAATRVGDRLRTAAFPGRAS